MDSAVDPGAIIDQYLAHSCYLRRDAQPADVRALIMEALHACGFEVVHTGLEMAQCEGCGTMFWRGGTFGRRADAVFCAEECRIEHKNLRNSKRSAA